MNGEGPDLFDVLAEEATRPRYVAPSPHPMVDVAAENTDAWWASLARTAITDLAATGRPFSADHVRDMGVPDPDHPNRWGAAFSSARKAGVIRRVGYAPSTTESRHGGVVTVWQGVAA